MFTQIQLNSAEELFAPLTARVERGVYFARFTHADEALLEALSRLCDEARQSGAVIDGKLPNPEQQHLEYYRNTLGDAVAQSAAEICSALERWTPRLSPAARQLFADGLFEQLTELRRAGKPDGAVKNVYIKLMCWLYYRFERICPRLGGDMPPRIVYCGSGITQHELIMLRLLNRIGADIALIEPAGDEAYLRLDPDSRWSQLFTKPGAPELPNDITARLLIERYNAAHNPIPARRPQQLQAQRPMPQAHSVQPSQRQQAPAQPAQPQSAPRRGVQFTRPDAQQAAADRGGVQFTQPAAPQPGVVNAPPQQPNTRQNIPQLVLPQDVEPAKPRGVQFTQPDASQYGAANTPAQQPPLQQNIPQLVLPGDAAPAKPRGVQFSPAAPSSYGGAQIGGPAAAAQPPRLQLQAEPPRKALRVNEWSPVCRPNDALQSQAQRASDSNEYCSLFVRVEGVDDQLTYPTALYELYSGLMKAKRRVVIVNGELSLPDNAEIQRIRRSQYNDERSMITGMAVNLPASANIDLQRYMRCAFYDTMCLAAEEERNLRRLEVTAVYLLCWLRRFQNELYSGWDGVELPCFIKMGRVATRNEALFIYMVSQLPADVLVFEPDKSLKSELNTPRVHEVIHAQSMPQFVFPTDSSALPSRTVAATAEREINQVLYNNTGVYRNNQFSNARAVPLDCTYDEVFQLWDKELRFRPNFRADGPEVVMPVIYAKISGVERGRDITYWQRLKAHVNSSQYFISSFPHIAPGACAAQRTLANNCFKNGRLLTDRLRTSPNFPFGMLRPEKQEHMLRCLEELLQRGIMRTSGSTGNELTIIATVLSMPDELLKVIHSFSFTGLNPKLVCLSTSEQNASFEDAVFITYLSMIGFDVLMFVPTAFQVIEKHLNDRLPREYIEGEYRYDMNMPNLATVPDGGLIASFIRNIRKR